jgi:hypothetical protein
MRGSEVAGLDLRADELREPRLGDRGMPRGQFRDLGRDDIDADDPMAIAAEARGRDAADVSDPEDGDLAHGWTPGRGDQLE